MSTLPNLPWLQSAQAHLTSAHTAGRMPHGVLIHEDSGAGGSVLARWGAQLFLCRASAARPCGACVDCKWVAADQHPDCAWVAPDGESRQIVVDQVRATIGELALTDHSGRGKVVILSPAEALNANAANALLKTLEEPTARTVLVLVCTQPSRLPATIRSRCQTLRLSSPPRAIAARWLTEHKGAGDWASALAITGTGPIALLDADPAAIVATQREVAAALQSLVDGSLAPPAIADSWARSDLELKLACTESWVTDRIYAMVGVPRDSTELGAAPHLPGALQPLNIRLLLELQTAVRDVRALLQTSINKSYAVESLLWRWAQVRST